jgi:hypothetical protein
MPRSPQAQAGFELVVEVTDGDAAHLGHPKLISMIAL